MKYEIRNLLVMVAMVFGLLACDAEQVQKTATITVSVAQLTTSIDTMDETLKESDAIYEANKHLLTADERVQRAINLANIKAFVDALNTLKERESAGKVALSVLEFRGLLQTAETSYQSTKAIATPLAQQLDEPTRAKMRDIDKQASLLSATVHTLIDAATEGIDPENTTQAVADTLTIMQSIADITKNLKQAYYD